MLWQFHHQFKDGHTEMKSQSRDFPETTPEVVVEYQAWVRQQVKDFPPPENAQNMVCNEKSEFFVWAVKEI